MLLAQVQEGADLIKGVTQSAPVLAAFIIIVIAFLVFLFMLMKADRDDRLKRELAAAQREVARDTRDSEREVEREKREKERDRAFIDGMQAAGVACHNAQSIQTEKYERIVAQSQQVIERNTAAHHENTSETRGLRKVIEERL